MSSIDITRCINCSMSSDFSDISLKRCSRCKTVCYCSEKCQQEHWPIHKPICRVYNPDEVWGIEMLSLGDAKRNGIVVSQDDKDIIVQRQRFRHILLKKGHPALSKLKEMCPVTRNCGVPLWIHSTALFTGKGLEAEGGGNQPAVYLRIEVDDGFAPMHWQMNDPGTCIVWRYDRKPLTREVLETMFKFCAKLLDAFGYPESDGWAPASHLMTPASWQLFSRDYYAAQKEKGRKGFNEFYTPL